MGIAHLLCVVIAHDPVPDLKIAQHSRSKPQRDAPSSEGGLSLSVANRLGFQHWPHGGYAGSPVYVEQQEPSIKRAAAREDDIGERPDPACGHRFHGGPCARPSNLTPTSLPCRTFLPT